MKKWMLLLVAVLLCFGLVACSGSDDKVEGDSAEKTCDHTFKKATCTDPEICEKCGESKGVALGHNFAQVTCTEPAKCIDCGYVRGEATGHKYSEATCEEAAKCTVCGKVDGEPLGHNFKEATCEAPSQCANCGKTTGVALGHKFGKGTCTNPGVCSACGKAGAEPTEHTFTNTSPLCTKCGAADPNKPYVGKTLEIWGLGTEDSYTDYDQFGKGNYLWMMRAAIEEWASMNGVTIQWCGSYNENALLVEMNSGKMPDLVFQTNQFPAIANLGFVSRFTDAEYNELAAICGNSYLDLMKHRNNSVGVIYPWTGMQICYYNKSMFERYGVKTPKEYLDEGNWTWETFMTCMEAMTKDLDSDGEIDTYGLPNNSFNNLVNPWAENEKDELISTIDEPWMRDFIQMKYDAYTVKKVVWYYGKNQIQKNVTYPMYAMQISDCEPYNFEHMYQTISNGDELEVVPVPVWEGANGERKAFNTLTQSGMSLLASCNERDAAVDCMAYVLQCGMKYISDFSLGEVKCDYAGIQGTCELSAKWKEAFAAVCKDRAKDYKELVAEKSYVPAHIAKVNAYLAGSDKYITGTYAGVSSLTDFKELIQMPPAESIPAIKQKYQAALDRYNRNYIEK